jgi:hypothetical protein
MLPSSTISWIFMATALASQNAPADVPSISSAADAINHAIPTGEELQMSFNWLQLRNLITRTEEKFSLTKEGIALYKLASKKTSVWMKIWTNLEQLLKDK